MGQKRKKDGGETLALAGALADLRLLTVRDSSSVPASIDACIDVCSSKLQVQHGLYTLMIHIDRQKLYQLHHVARFLLPTSCTIKPIQI